MAIEAVYLHPEDYDLEVASRQVDDIPFWLDLAQQERPRRVLEVGCGTGRLTIPLARAGAEQGFEVVGLEAEEPMLARARQLCQAEPPLVQQALTLVQGDVRAMRLPCRFELIVMPYGIAHHLIEVDDQIAALRSARDHMHPGGLLCIDLGAPDMQFLAQAQRGVPRHVDLEAEAPSGHRLTRTVASTYTPTEQRVVHAYRYESVKPDGGRDAYPSDFTMHVFFPREVELLCRHTGFRIERMLGFYSGEPCADRSPLMIVLARAV